MEAVPPGERCPPQVPPAGGGADGEGVRRGHGRRRVAAAGRGVPLHLPDRLDRGEGPLGPPSIDPVEPDTLHRLTAACPNTELILTR